MRWPARVTWAAGHGVRKEKICFHYCKNSRLSSLPVVGILHITSLWVRWFSNFRMLWHVNIVPRVVVTPIIKSLHCYFITVILLLSWIVMQISDIQDIQYVTPKWITIHRLRTTALVILVAAFWESTVDFECMQRNWSSREWRNLPSTWLHVNRNRN